MSKKNLCLVAIVSLLACIFSPLPAEAESYNVGFRTIGYVNQNIGIRLDINVWYPAKRKAKRLSFFPWKIKGAHFANPLPGESFPLIILSHPSTGNRFSFHDTAYALAQEGFVVAAPTHQMDNMDNMPQLYTWEQVATRAKELSALLDILQDTPALKNTFNPNKVGVLGFGTGGTAALMLGGAQHDCFNWGSYCGQEEEGYYCNAWAKLRIKEQFCAGLSKRPSLKDSRFRAEAIVSPNFSMLFTKRSLAGHTNPVLFAMTGKDKGNPPKVLEDLARMLPTHPQLMEFPNSSPTNFLALCPESLAMELPEICLPNTLEAHREVFDVFVQQLSSFFHKHLGSVETRIPESNVQTAKLSPSPVPQKLQATERKAPEKGDGKKKGLSSTRRLLLSQPPDKELLR